MNAEFENIVKSLPSHFEVIANDREYTEDAMIGLGNNLEELVLSAYGKGYALVASLAREKTGRGELLSLTEADNQKYSLFDIGVIDLGQDGVYLWEKDAPKLKKMLLGKQPVSDRDVARYFENRVEKGKGKGILGLDATSFGNFIESYEPNSFFLDIDDTDETNRFFGDTVPVVMEQELYFKLERFMRRKGLLEDNQLIDPIVSYSDSSGRFIVSLESEDKYFNEFQDFIKISQDERNVLGIKNLQYNK